MWWEGVGETELRLGCEVTSDGEEEEEDREEEGRKLMKETWMGLSGSQFLPLTEGWEKWVSQISSNSHTLWSDVFKPHLSRVWNYRAACVVDGRKKCLIPNPRFIIFRKLATENFVVKQKVLRFYMLIFLCCFPACIISSFSVILLYFFHEITKISLVEKSNRVCLESSLTFMEVNPDWSYEITFEYSPGRKLVVYSIKPLELTS